MWEGKKLAAGVSVFEGDKTSSKPWVCRGLLESQASKVSGPDAGPAGVEVVLLGRGLPALLSGSQEADG